MRPTQAAGVDGVSRLILCVNISVSDQGSYPPTASTAVLTVTLRLFLRDLLLNFGGFSADGLV